MAVVYTRGARRCLQHPVVLCAVSRGKARIVHLLPVLTMTKMIKPRFFRSIVCCVLFLSVWEICARVDDYMEEGAPLFGNYGMSTMLTHDAFGVIGRPY